MLNFSVRHKTPSAADLPAFFPTLRQAPPACARLALEAEKQLRALGIEKGAHLLLSVSGGADSAALACLMALLAPKMQTTFSIVTCDHGLRPESAAEVRFVQALGKLLHVPVTSLSLGLDREAAGIEEKARKARYAAIEEVREKESAQWLVLAHHAGDLREDIVLRLLRGTGWPGLGGMQAKDEQRRILRPLLYVEPQRLRTLLKDLGIPHCEDASNLDTRYRRNRIRHELLPLLEKESPALSGSLLDLARLAGIDRDFFARETAKALQDCSFNEQEGSAHIPMPLLLSLPKALRLRLYLAVIQAVARTAGRGQARSPALLSLDCALEKRQWPKTFQLPGALTLELSRQGLNVQAQRQGKSASSNSGLPL